MVVKAEQIKIFGVGLAAVDPVDSMVGFGPGGWPVAAGPDAATVTGDQEMPEAGADGAGTAAEVEDFGIGAVDGGDDPGVARHPAGGSGGQALPFRGAGGAESVEQGLMGQADDDGVPATALTVAGFGMGGGVTGHVHQSFSPAVADGFGEQITVRIGFAEELGDGFGDDETGFGVELAVDTPTPIKGFRHMQMLRRPLTRRVIG